jgi:hypothetical protein
LDVEICFVFVFVSSPIVDGICQLTLWSCVSSVDGTQSVCASGQVEIIDTDLDNSLHHAVECGVELGETLLNAGANQILQHIIH